MKIGIFTDTYEPKIDGIVASVRSYSRELEKLGHTVKIYSPKSTFWSEENGLKISAKNTRIPSFSYYAYPDFRLSLPYDPRIIRVIQKEKFDIIYTQTPGSIGILGITVARLFGIPAVHIYHTHLEKYAHYFPAPEIMTKFGVRQYVRAYINRHDAAIAPSTAIKKVLEDYSVSIPTYVLPTGVDIADMNAAKEKTEVAEKVLTKYNIPKGAKFIITFSRVGKEKNLPFLLDVFKNISKKYPELYFIIAGGGPFEKELTGLIKELPCQDKIRQTGFITHGSLFPLVAKAQIFLSASTTETQGLTTLESMAVGVPVVAVCGSGVEDTLAGDMGGYLVPEDLEKFCEKVELLLDNPNVRTQKSAEAITKARELSTEAETKKLLAIFESVQKKNLKE